ncbi:MAG: hypothetical protein HFI09_01410 [Bacilli bacterium]|nr:hypothetical protein [Bacilli bacterium]
MKDKIISIGFLLLIFSLGIIQIFTKDQEVSQIERRKLVTIEEVKEDFTATLDSYLSDQIPFRNTFLKLNQIWNREILGNKEHNNTYKKKDFLIEKLYPLNEKSKNNFINQINKISQKYLKENHSFIAIIPDKSYFLENSFTLKLNYQKLYQELKDNINLNWLSLEQTFTLKDYFKTDIHLKQEAYFKIIETLKQSFELEDVKTTYIPKSLANFKGTSFYKLPFNNEEELTFFESPATKNAIVKHLEYQDDLVYDLEKQKSSDMYNIFLSGPSSLIEIINPDSLNQNELIIFRDSFASSLAPLLIPYYHKITLIDLRYIQMDYVANLVDFTNKDVLFLYSTLMVNNSFILKA